ncbi:hypothetical protein JCM4814A_73190 [Streptomyces phaeofaciens JCM 4814]|uniref:Uncharacterized protein n=1 Tax=Streptomyces phaeofaciens TaxID=68254 RepID=A0A918HGE7_9ACTN|nr:hypothetical protein [Streptomyces phaeofaciens]GGT62685.1 hypothetical protein GCM10010226_45650 [Streptomyces phaeofaciens]
MPEHLTALDTLLPADFLSQLAALRDARDQLDQQIRAHLAYGREFVGPRPYTLASLADAAGLSISGVRTAYTDADRDAVAQALGRPPRSQT